MLSCTPIDSPFYLVSEFSLLKMNQFCSDKPIIDPIWKTLVRAVILLTVQYSEAMVVEIGIAIVHDCTDQGYS